LIRLNHAPNLKSKILQEAALLKHRFTMSRLVFPFAIGLLLVLTACGSTAQPTAAPAPTPTRAAQPTAPPAPAASNEKSACTGTRLVQRRTNYKLEEVTKVDANKNYGGVIETAKGAMKLEFYPKLAPMHVSSFIFLACQGFFDGLTFHRYEPGFVIQGGDPNGNGSGGPGYNLKAEFNSTLHTAGILSMARTPDPNSAGSQFFIMLGAAPHLDNQYTVFGKVTDGMNVVMQIRAGDKMNRVDIFEK
jgi:cyclophilin family peptidyl-prolyl cis-trans isomerase